MAKCIIPALALLCLLAGAADAQWVWTPQTGRWINVGDLPKETPELQIEHARTLMLEGDYRAAWRETNKFTRYYGDSEYAAENQFLRGEIRLAQGRLLDAAEQFQQVVAAYPESVLFDDVIEKQYAIGDQLYAEGLERMDRRWVFFRERPLRRAADVYTMVIDNEPFTTRAAEAQYKVGLTQYTRENYMEAAFEYRRVIEDYGTSDWVDEASYGLAQCYYEMSYPPDYDQSPSALAIMAINDFQDRYPADERNADLDDKREEMRARIAQQRLQTAQYYERRREFESAKLSYQVVAREWPGTPAAETAQAWLDEHEHIVASPFRYQDVAAR